MSAQEPGYLVQEENAALACPSAHNRLQNSSCSDGPATQSPPGLRRTFTISDAANA